MKKLLTFLTLLTLFFGVGWAATVTLQYTGSTTTNMTGNNDAATLGLSATDWSVIGAQNDASGLPGLNKDGTIRLYGHATGEGSTLTVSSLTGATINSITITYDGTYNNGYVSVGGNNVTGNSGTYTIGSSSFVVGNANSATTQVRIKSIVIDYTASGVTTYNVTGTGQTVGGTVTASPAGGVPGTSITITATPDNGYELETLIVDGDDVTSDVNSDNEYTFSMPSHHVAVSATFSAISQGNVEWVLTSPSSLTTGDVVLIVDKTTKKAMANSTGNTGPSAVSVTLNDGKTLVTAGATSDLQWTVTNNNGTFNFTVPNSSNYLYCISDNNGLRIGTGQDDYKDFTIYDNNGVDFLYNTERARYIGVYNSTNWRSYTTINSNIQNTVLGFYKRVQTGTHAITVDEDIEHGTVVTDEQSGSQGDEITITVTPETGYELTALDYNGTSITPTAGNAETTYSFTMPDADVTIHATFSLISYTITTSGTNGTVSTNPSGSATMGQTVTVTATPDSGYKLSTLTYTPEGGTAVDITEGKTFEMPAANVTVTATFIEDKALYILGMINGAGGQPHQAVKMNYDGTKYTANIWVIGNSSNALGEPGSWFAFTKVVAENDNGWDYVNGYRFEPAADDANYVLNGVTTTPVTLYKRYWDKSFLIRSGLYRVTVTPTNNDEGWTFSLDEVKDLTPTITPEGGDVALGTTATASIGEDFNTFISSCNPVVDAWGNTVSITPPVARFYVNNELVNGTSKEISLDAVGETTVAGKCALYVNGNDEYAARTASETYNVYRTYSATIASGITGGTVAFNSAGTNTSLNNLTEGYEVRVYVTPNENFALTSLSYTVEGSSEAVDITNNVDGYYTFNMPAGNVTINATFTGTVTTRTFELTNVLEADAKYIIVYEGGPMAMAKTTEKTEITIDNHKTTISSDSDVDVFTLGGSDGAWTLKSGNNYLTTSSSGTTLTTSSTAATWSISFDDDKNASVYGGNTSNKRYIRAWGTTNFRAYSSESQSGTNDIQLYKEVGVNAPTFSIAGGSFLNSEYPDGINVELTCSTDGATIYYSTDGEKFSEYSNSPIHVTSTTTISAYATKDGKQSNTVSATYNFVDYIIADVVFSPASGEYYHDQTCQMFTTTKGARIYYTTDGSEPKMNEGTTQLYTGEIPMTAGNTYNFKAVAYIGTTPSQVSTANYNILTGDYPGTYNYLYSIAELNAHETSTSFWTIVNPVQVVYMSTYQNAGNSPEFCLVRDNTGYGMIYFGKNNTNHSGYKVFNMGDWIEGGYYGTISWAYSQQHGQLDTHPELGDSYTNSARIRNWPSSAISNSVVLPEYLTIPQILASGTTGNTDYWGHYVHLRKNTVQLIESDDPGTYTTGQDKDGKWSGTITDENGNQINYYDKFYLQIDKGWTIDNNMFTGHPNRTFDIYGFVACHLPAEIDYQISPFDFAWIDKPVIDKETATYYEPQTVTLSSPEDPTATIWYKTDDMDDYAVYTEPFEVNSTTTVSWYATKQSQYNDELESLIGSITMTFEEIAKPVISPESVVKAVGESVDASIAFETGKTIANGAEIVYTTDGSDPKTSETAQVYTLGTTMTFTTTTTVRAITRVGSGDRYLYSAEADAKTYTFVKSNGIEYTLITDVRNLKENGVYVILSQNYNEALSTTQNVNNRGAAGVLFVENTNKAKVYGNDDVAQFTLTVLTHEEDNAPERHFLMQTNNSDQNGYLYVGHDVQNTLMTEAEEDAMGNDVAVITIDADGRAHIHFNYAGGDNRYLQYWNRDRLFNTYKSEYDDRAVYIYGIEATPLATIEKEGVTTEGMNQYTIADQLLAVYADGDKGMLWCKDQGNVSIAKTEKQEGQIDFMKEITEEQTNDWDQSNWVVLQFSEPTTDNGVKALVEGAVGKYIKPATIQGTYTDALNYTITMADDALQLEEDGETYVKNLYCTANFLPKNLNINGGQGAAGIYHGEDAFYFFMNPKVQEVCEITYAEWEGNNTFIAPLPSATNPIQNDSQIDGAFTVDWTYNVTDQAPDLTPGAAYRFLAVVQRTEGSNYLKANEPGRVPSSDFIVYPLNLDGGAGNIVTGINKIDVDGSREVKSVKYVNVAGMVSDKPFSGVNIVVTEYTDGSRSTTKMLRK